MPFFLRLDHNLVDRKLPRGLQCVRASNHKHLLAVFHPQGHLRYNRQGTYLDYFLDAIEFPASTPVSEWVSFKINFFCAFQLVTDCPHLMKANNLFWEEWQALTSLPAGVIVCNKDDFSHPCTSEWVSFKIHIFCAFQLLTEFFRFMKERTN